MSRPSLRTLRCLAVRARAGAEDGAAMVTVLGTVMVLTLMLGAVMAYASAGQVAARGGQDWSAALAAADAGVDLSLIHI